MLNIDRMVNFLIELKYSNLSQEVINHAKERLIDFIACAIYGCDKPWSKYLIDCAENKGSNAESSILGATFLVDPATASLVNGTMGHAFEIDDTHDPSITHPGSVVIPASLSLAEKNRIDGENLLVSIIVGYEFMTRIGMCAGSSLIHGGFHPTSTNGTFGSTAAASKLLNMSKNQCINALGIAGSLASGLMQFSLESQGTMVKRLHAGRASENGVFSALLAEQGFTGPKEILEGVYGFCNVFSKQPDFDKLTLELGNSFEIANISTKPYACCRLFHSIIDGISYIKNHNSFSINEIEKVTVYGPEIMITQHMLYTPSSIMSAQYSLPYVTAASILYELNDPDCFNEENLGNSELLELAKLVDAKTDDRLNKLFPEKFAAKVEVKLKNGKLLIKEVLDSKGTVKNPLNEKEIEQKFINLTKHYFSNKKQSEMLTMLRDMENINDTSSLMKAMRPDISNIV